MKMHIFPSSYMTDIEMNVHITQVRHMASVVVTTNYQR